MESGDLLVNLNPLDSEDQLIQQQQLLPGVAVIYKWRIQHIRVLGKPTSIFQQLISQYGIK